MALLPTQAPRSAKCNVCKLVAAPHMLTILLFDEQLHWLPLDGAIEYQREVGLTATERQLRSNAMAHRRHVEKWMTESGGAVAPAHPGNGDEGVVRIPPPTGPATWIDTVQQGMDVGLRALGLIEQRLPTLEAGDLISIAKIGQNAAATRANLEMKGQIKRMEQITALASGFKKPSEA